MAEPTENRNQYALAALKERRAIVAGELAAIERQAHIKRDALGHVDAVLKMFAPDIDPARIPTRRPSRVTAYPIDNLNRRVLDILRGHGESLTTPDVVDAIATDMGYGEDAQTLIQHRVRHALWHLAKGDKATVRKEGTQAATRWSLR